MFKFFLFVSGVVAHDAHETCSKSRDPNSIKGGAIDQDSSYEHLHCAVQTADGGYAFGHICCSCDRRFVTGDHFCHAANKTGVVGDFDLSDTGDAVYMATEDDTVQRQLTHDDAHHSCNDMCSAHLGLTHAYALRHASPHDPYSRSSSAVVHRHSESDSDSDEGEAKETHKTGITCADSRFAASIHGSALDKFSGDQHQHCAVLGSTGNLAYGHICCQCAGEETLDHYCHAIDADGNYNVDATDFGQKVFNSNTDGRLAGTMTHHDVHDSCDDACSAAGHGHSHGHGHGHV